MIPAETERFWSDYLAAERIRIRRESLGALDRFVAALLHHPPEVWHSWARQLARRIVDEGEDISVRMPLFRSVLFPALLAGVQNSVEGSARWLAGFAPLIYQSPSCADRLPRNCRSAFDLLQQAVHDDPNDSLAKKRLLTLMRSRFGYVLHELPAGVLYGHDSATLQECDELLLELSDYERLAMELGGGDEDRELITEARFHIPAYRRYLAERRRDLNYEAFLSQFTNVPHRGG